MTKSFSGKIWNFLKSNEEDLKEIKKHLDIDDLVARILLNRGFSTHAEIDAFLGAKLKNTIPDPSLLLDMDKGVERLVNAIIEKQNLMVLGDYDVDGITSTYLLVKYLDILGLKAKYYIPNRFQDGYGISKGSIQMTNEQKANLIIAVDCGINSIEEIQLASEFGIDSIILDHHLQLQNELPKCTAIINPNRLDQEEIGTSHIKHLCAAGVVFLFIIALQRTLKNIGFFKDKIEPNLLDFTDIVTLGTLCDVMELKGINRAITKYALANNKYSIGITSLMNEMNLENISTPEDISFFIGPAINAAGRTADPHIALNLLLEKCPIKSQKIASQLLNLNNQRRTIEKQLLTEALLIINEKKLFNNNGICVFGSNWHEGIIGIIAGRIKDKFKKPAFVIAFNEDEIGKGSARSVSGINIGLFFNKAKSAGIILEGGGHALAGGFTIHKSKINEFCEFINSNIGNEFVNSIDIDHQISPMSNLSKISELLLQIEPFGKGIEKPLFCMERVRIKSSRKTTSGTHLMLSLAGELETGNIKAILFNINSKLDIVNAIEQNNGSLFDIAGFIDSNKQFGQSIIIEDIRLSIR